MRVPRSLPRPGRRALLAVDVAAAAVLATGGVLSARALDPRPSPVAICLAALCGLSVAFRRRAPAAAFAASVSSLVAYQLVSHDPNMAFEPYAVALNAYMAGRRLPPARAAAAAFFGLAVLLVLQVHPAENPLPATLIAWLLAVVAAIAAGRVVARHHEMAVRLAAATGRLRHDQDARAARLAAEERTRVARELHDVTAHSVSVMVIQASAARLLAPIDQRRARRALRIAVRSGREAIDDLRRMLGVLRRGEDDMIGVLPDERGLEQLISRARSAGADVRFTARGDIDRLSAGTRFVLYRVVQEALTNAVRHGGDGPVAVTVSAGPDDVVATVANPLGRGRAGSSEGASSGHGLVGMQERVTVLGGQLLAGATDGGAFRVEARLPAGGIALPLPPADPADPADPPSATAPGLDARFGPRVIDLAVAGFWLVVLGLDAASSGHRSGPLVLNLLGVAAMAAACFWRRRFPIGFALFVDGIAVLMTHGLTSRNYATLVGGFTATVPPYTVAAWAERRRAIGYLVVVELATAAVAVFEHAAAGGIFGPALFTLVAWLAGRAVRHERLLAEQLREAARRLVAEDADHARLAVIGERTRLTRDLHGLVARQVEAMVIQAEVAEQLLGFDQRRLEDALEAVEETGRSALAQMRATVGVLRAAGDRAPREPQPGVALVHTLVRELRERGRDVRFGVDGEPFPLPPAVDLAAYRILEDALTAPASRPVDALLRFAEEAVEIEVRAGEHRRWPTPAMCERVELCNGRLAVTPADGRGPTRLVVSLRVAVEALVG